MMKIIFSCPQMNRFKDKCNLYFFLYLDVDFHCVV